MKDLGYSENGKLRQGRRVDEEKKEEIELVEKHKV
jgi:hypothetical protein